VIEGTIPHKAAVNAHLQLIEGNVPIPGEAMHLRGILKDRFTG